MGSHSASAAPRRTPASPRRALAWGGARLFANGWGVFAPYVVAYALFQRMAWPLATLHAIFLALHAFNLLALVAYLIICRPRVGAPTLCFWLALGLLFLLPGAYLEFPSDPWDHFSRHYAWSLYDTIAEGSFQLTHKFSYFWGWTLIGRLPILDRQWAMGFYSAFWQLLLAYQFRLLFGTLGLSPAWARVQVLATVCLFGTNLFGFYRYYALSSTMLAYIVYLRAVIVAADLLCPDQVRRPRALRRWASGLAQLALLGLMMFYNHTQELMLLGMSLSALVFHSLIARAATRRWALAGLVLVTVAGLACGALAIARPELFARWGRLPQPSLYLTRLATFRIWDPALPFAQTIGVHGLAALLCALLLLRRAPRLALLTLAPFYMLLFPPFVFVFLTGQPSDYVTYRALYAFPTSIALVAGLRALLDGWGRLPERAAPWVVAALITVVALPPWFPWRGRLWFQVHRPPQSLTLRDFEQTAARLAQRRDLRPTCVVGADNATEFALRAYFPTRRSSSSPAERREPFNLGHYAASVAAVEAFVRDRSGCALLVAMPEHAIPDSTVAALSGHWRPSLVRDDLTLPEPFTSVLDALVAAGWRQAAVPPFHRLYSPPVSPAG